LIRGVNRQIIEISQTDSEFFERALLFVRPGYAGLDNERLRHEANKMLATIGTLPAPAPRRRITQRLRRRLAFLSLFFLAALLCAAVLILLLR